MSNIKTILLFAVTLFISSSITAQDIHFTQFNLAPLHLNPALTGQFEGTFRIGGLYREQENSVITDRNNFKTPSIYIDAPVFRGFGKNDWIGLGANLINDKVGTASYNNTVFMAGLSYHIALGSKSNTIISIGGQGGMIQKRIDLSDPNVKFHDEIVNNTGHGTSQDLGRINDDKISYGDYNAGISIRSALNKSMNFNIGFSMRHLGKPKYTVYTDAGAATVEDQDLLLEPRVMIGHGEFNIDLSPKWVFSPSFLYMGAAGTNTDQMGIQAMAGRHFNPEKDITFRFGAGYRLSDAVEALIGFDFKGLRIGAAYDITVSERATANINQGAFEIAASYIAKIRKAPVVKPVIFCPRF